MILTQRDKDSELWRKLTTHFNELINKAQKQNENESNAAEKTAALRGRIKVLREILKTDNPASIETEITIDN